MDDISYEATLGRERELEHRQRRLERECELRSESEQVERRQSGGFSKLFQFLLSIVGGVFVVKFFFHPPSSRPTSIKSSRISPYCLVENNLFSQAISIKNFSLSIFEITLFKRINLSVCAVYLRTKRFSSTSINKMSIFSPIPNRSGLGNFLYKTSQYEYIFFVLKSTVGTFAGGAIVVLVVCISNIKISYL